MNWGKSIILAFILFGSFIGFLVYRMMRTQVDLVRPDYYQTEMAYQQQIDRVAHTKTAKELVTMQYRPQKQQVQFSVPNTVQEGKIQFFRPSDAKLDFTVAVRPGAAAQTISTETLKTGYWRVKVTWSDGNQEYYTEEEIII
ncbi:FixH family protein [Siphonobacter curvatus]|uniref:Nitrogen fixation protein FixH n=1 Tax=Siphonobacter curvatus TaxID=2094562 RepID=A0A2S7IT18_9BACT|nr:FixH family protein [Siphonobacter curvatus]PQA60844.1 nitrogen fixation protein FixH [Siphonobacter curvatus]